SLSDLPAAEAQRVDQVCNRFEAAWKDWQDRVRPVLEDWLGEVTGPGRAGLLYGLVRRGVADPPQTRGPAAPGQDPGRRRWGGAGGGGGGLGGGGGGGGGGGSAAGGAGVPPPRCPPPRGGGGGAPPSAPPLWGPAPARPRGGPAATAPLPPPPQPSPARSGE